MALSWCAELAPARPSLVGRSPKIPIHWIGILGSPTSDGVDDFYPVAFPEGVRRKAATGDQILVDLHGDAFAGQIERLHQVRHRGLVAHIARFTVNYYIHIHTRVAMSMNAILQQGHRRSGRSDRV